MSTRRERFPFYRDHFGCVHTLNSADLLLLDFLYELDEVGIWTLSGYISGEAAVNSARQWPRHSTKEISPRTDNQEEMWHNNFMALS